MEKRDLYDNNKQLTGLTFYKGNPIPPGYYFLVVVVFIQNSKGEFLIQKRSARKDGKWATTGGHPKAGETSRQGIIMEVQEELGLDISQDNFIYFKELKDEDCYCDLYYLQKDIDINEIICQPEEVEKVKWATSAEIDTLFKNGEFKKTHYQMFQECLVYLKEKNS